MTPLLSVVSLCYNHGLYIEKSIIGVLSQKTSFVFEYIIHDDASTDSSRKIIEYYASLYPNIIFPVFQDVNQYSLGVPISFNLFKYKARGKYIALCECDDYWTDNTKLQKQVDYLESNNMIAGVAHRSIIVDKNGNPKCRNFKENFYFYRKHRLYTLKDFELGFQPGQTATWVFRKELVLGKNEKDFNKITSVKSTGDTKIAALLAIQGGIYCMDDVMSCYRLVNDSGSSWNARIKNKNMSKFFYDANKSIMRLIDDLYGYKIKPYYINSNILLGTLKKYINNRNKENYKILLYIYSDMEYKLITLLLLIFKILLIIPKIIFKKLLFK